MRGLWITFLPLLAAAALTVWGGERLARRDVETRIPADRKRLHDFADAFRGELDRIDQLYLDHLQRIAADAPFSVPEAVAEACRGLAATRECHVFRDTSKQFVASGARPPGDGTRLPEIVIEGGKRPLVPEQAVVLPRSLSNEATTPGASGVVFSTDGNWQIQWVRPDAGHLVAFTVDAAELRRIVDAHLREWLAGPFAPLREAGEMVSLVGPAASTLASLPGGVDPGPAALVMPHRTRLGEWQLLAWDKLQTATAHDSPTLFLSGGIGTAMVLLGAFLFVQQRRALRLAEERVSFVNRVSHELGSPLTNILLNLDLAAGSIRERPAESGRRLSLVNEEVQRLARLVGNVLTFSRGERKTLDLSPQVCVPDEVVEGVLSQFQPSLDRRKVRVEWRRDALATTRLDCDALAQIVGNLISNVEKYASSGGLLEIHTAMEHDRLRIRVSDRGPGIPASRRERVFEAFERVHRGVNEGSSGTGLGLTIARDLARRMGGDLMLVPAPAGATFELDLPARIHLSVVDHEAIA